MSFTRSNSGISNSHIFFDVDYLVYSEGGSCQGAGDEFENNSWSIDSVFWKSVFLRFRPELKVKIKSLGSKECVRPYANKIAENVIVNSIAVFDRDYAPYKGEVIPSSHVLYTYGYSWENDAWHPDFIKSALDSIHCEGKIPDAFSRDIDSRYSRFIKNINRVVYVDFLCGLVNVKGLDRENFWSLIDASNPLDVKVKVIKCWR